MQYVVVDVFRHLVGNVYDLSTMYKFYIDTVYGSVIS